MTIEKNVGTEKCTDETVLFGLTVPSLFKITVTKPLKREACLEWNRLNVNEYCKVKRESQFQQHKIILFFALFSCHKKLFSFAVNFISAVYG
jgi:hypothetical protein